MVLTLSCALLIIIELGVSIIYSDYIYNPAKGLISINVASQSYNDPNWEPGMENPTSSQNAANLMRKSTIGQQCKAAVIHKNAFSAGCGYSDYSDGCCPHLAFQRQRMKPLAARESTRLKATRSMTRIQMITYCFRAKLIYRILGTFSDEGLPLHLQAVIIFYPLTMSEVTDGVYLTDATEIDSLLKLFDDKGYEILHVQRPLSFFALVNRMLSDGFVTRAVACAMVGLFFCFIYSIVMLYRENLKSLRIRHIFGLSMKQITLGSLGIATLIAAVAVGVFSVILFSGLSYMSKHDLNLLFCYITVGIAALSAGTSLVCAISTNRAVSRRERP